MQNSLRSDSCIFAPDADSCELRVSRHPANAIRGSPFQSVPPGSLPSSRAEHHQWLIVKSLRLPWGELLAGCEIGVSMLHSA